MQECWVCDTAFGKTEDCPEKHYKEGHDGNYVCEECRYKTMRRTDMQTHVRLHTGARPLVCPAGCNKTFNVRSKLKEHMQKFHDDAPKYWCTTCDFKTNFAKELKWHTDACKFAFKMALVEYDDFIEKFDSVCG